MQAGSHVEGFNCGVEGEAVNKGAGDENVIGGVDVEFNTASGEAVEPGCVGAQDALGMPGGARGEADVEKAIRGNF